MLERLKSALAEAQLRWAAASKLLPLGPASWQAAAATERQSSRRNDSAHIDPHLERMQPCGAMFTGGDVVAAKMEEVGDLFVSGESAPCMPQ